VTTPSPAIPSFTDGTVVHQADLNALGSNLTNIYNYLLGGFRTEPPIVVAQQTVAQTIATGVTAQMSYDTAVVNTNSMWVSSSPTQITIQTGGIYLALHHVVWNASYTGYRFCGITLNGTTTPTNYITNATYYDNSAAGGTSTLCAAVYPLSVGAVLYPLAGQGSGGNQVTQVSSALNSFIAVCRLSI